MRSSVKFGRLPAAIPVGLRFLPHYTAGDLPPAPAKVLVPDPPPSSDSTPWGMDGNDQYGDCGVAGINHGFMATATISAETETFPTADQVVSYYLNYTGGQDDGVVLSAFLAKVRQFSDGFYGHTISGYAPVAVHDVPTLNFAIWAYGFAYTGVKVTQAMMDGFQAGKPWELGDTRSPVLGGHCVPIVGYDSRYLYAVTWGQVQPISYSAWHYISDEAWAVITGEFVSKGGDTRGVSLDALNSDLSKVNT